ncbi:D-alanyl-D-alanine carboxypeptidase family protein [Dictyobacter aurantiacus]|uniref:Peptidase S11 D-alanyl-D-alanine carboxypeptidase A N-terminal domain-containing protein n=1 Tax=Dictyobacter aurantiacus TaxID=1936993 RepID=A0A401ZPF2_9CHLR|nr:serine hydrolase [Dictyobacter aurantiacus]GCE08759.1 hypothetical protein KDAU_60880 [Dictyobacter aurantiacus]
MKRAVVATVLIMLALELLLTIPLMLLTPIGPTILGSLNPTPTPTPQPVLSASGQTPPTLKSPVSYLLDADTNDVLDNVRGNERLPVASTTKIMTAVIALEKSQPDQIVTVKDDAVKEVKDNFGSTADLKAGDKVRMIDLLYGLLLPSGDDAAIAIADTISGSPANFVKVMNAYAHKLHLNNTHYINPDGLTYYTGADKKPDPNEYSTAADLAQLTRYALRNPIFAQIVQIQHYHLPATADHGAYNWDTTDDLLQAYPGTIGVKTGFTLEAGSCLVFAAKNAKHTLIGVLLQGKDKNDRFTDAPQLLDWGFNLPLKAPTPTPTPIHK